jgi:hypothetical protein
VHIDDTSLLQIWSLLLASTLLDFKKPTMIARHGTLLLVFSLNWQ